LDASRLHEKKKSVGTQSGHSNLISTRPRQSFQVLKFTKKQSKKETKARRKGIVGTKTIIFFFASE